MSYQTELASRLADRFGATKSLSHSTQATKDTWTGEFVKRYSEPHRTYHTLSHIDAMLRCYDEASLDDEAVFLAIIFHDWVYEPLRQWNEARSAEVFGEFADQTGIPADARRVVEGLIEATVAHVPSDDEERSRLFLDFDLEVLSRTGGKYDSYAGQIRREYAHFGDEEYRKGRVKVLEAFLNRKRIYLSAAFAHREQIARENIRTEIARLKGDMEG